MECRRNVKRCLYLPALRSGGIDQPKTRPRTINPMRPFQLPKLLVLFPLAMHLAVVSASCQGINPGAARAAPPQNIKWDPFLDTLQERTIRWFLDVMPQKTGLTPDRWPAQWPPSSITAVGFEGDHWAGQRSE